MIRPNLVKILSQQVPNEKQLSIKDIEGICKQYRIYTEGPKSNEDSTLYEYMKMRRSYFTKGQNEYVLVYQLLNYRDVEVDDLPTLFGMKK